MQRRGPSETQILVASGLAVGVGAGLGAVAFRYLISGFSYLFLDVINPALATLFGSMSIMLIPALGGLIFGPMIYFFAREAKGHGVPEVMLAVALRGGKIRPIVAVIKSLASAVCIASGGSVGREGPIVQIGSALGSTVGQVFRMSDDRTRALVACGAAAGIAATFNAPIAGVFFALELILGEFTTRAFGIVVIASVTSAVIGRSAFGNVPAFDVPQYELVSLGEYGLYVILAALAAVLGVGFSKTLYWFEDVWDAIPFPEYLKPVPGGLILGAMGLFVPQILGVGYEAMGDALTGQYTIGLLMLLVVVKILAVSTTIGSGGSGGVFAPSLFIGSMFGTAFGAAAGAIFPGMTAPPGAYGLVGMAAVFSGAARAPISAVIILFELTGDYRIILPLMLAVVISTLISEALSADTIYTLKLRRRGIDLRAGRNVDLMRSIPVRHAMSESPVCVAGDMSVTEAAERLDDEQARALLLVDENGELDGIATIQDIERALLDNRPGATLSSVASRPVTTVFADDPLSQAIHRMGTHDLGQLPVVARANPRRVIGMLGRPDVVRAYSSAVRDSIETQRGGHVPLRELRDTQLVEFDVGPGTALADRRVADLPLPPHTLIVAVHRDHQTVIPRGDTHLHPGDRVTVLVREEAVGTLHSAVAALEKDGGHAHSDQGGKPADIPG
ncbi:MAG: chloride channel protein [Chloroflexota bacterium]